MCNQIYGAYKSYLKQPKLTPCWRGLGQFRLWHIVNLFVKLSILSSLGRVTGYCQFICKTVHDNGVHDKGFPGLQDLVIMKVIRMCLELRHDNCKGRGQRLNTPEFDGGENGEISGLEKERARYIFDYQVMITRIASKLGC